MSNKISLKEFKENFGGKIENITPTALSEIETKQVQSEEKSEEKTRKKYQYLEYELQKQIAQYLELKYPNVLFSSGVINLALTHRQRGMNSAIQKRLFSPPDMVLFEARRNFNGFFMELKTKSVYKENGKLLKNKHLEQQERSINKLIAKNFFAQFVWSFDQAKGLIDWYMSDESDKE